MDQFDLKQFIKQEQMVYQQQACSSTQIKAEDGFQGAVGPNLDQQFYQGNASSPIMRRRKPQALTTNQFEFVCSLCGMFLIEEQGVELKNCGHNFCHVCLVDSIENNPAFAHCPMVAEHCGVEITDDEIQALLKPEAYFNYLDKRHNIAIKQEKLNSMNTSTVPALLDLENYDYIENRQNFVCAVCLTLKEPGEGLILKNCLHEYCKDCLSRIIEMSDELEVPCPFVAEDGIHCEGILQDRELRSLITPEVYEGHLAKSLTRAEAVIKNSFHCQTANCPGWAEKGEGATQFHCPVCHKTNCIKCTAVHERKSCEEYFYEINADARKARDQQLTAAQEAQLIAQRLAMKCPGCGVLIQKTVGCNHMTCSRCRREFQWLGLQ